jgi:hypothetical protein
VTNRRGVRLGETTISEEEAVAVTLSTVRQRAMEIVELPL